MIRVLIIAAISIGVSALLILSSYGIINSFKLYQLWFLGFLSFVCFDTITTYITLQKTYAYEENKIARIFFNKLGVIQGSISLKLLSFSSVIVFSSFLSKKMVYFVALFIIVLGLSVSINNLLIYQKNNTTKHN